MNSVLKKKPDILIVDDHLIFRQGLKAIINYEDIGSVIGELSDGDEFIELLLSLKPDIVLMDIDLPGMNGFEATRIALEIIPDLKIIAFTMYSEVEYCQKMKELGAKGFILKSSGFNELENAIKTVMTGENYFANEQQKTTYHDTDPTEITKNTVNNNVQTTKKARMLFFPWVVKRKNCVNILNRK
jgi:DNA-binding NarL/FixJ family response regulator